MDDGDLDVMFSKFRTVRVVDRGEGCRDSLEETLAVT